MDKLKDMLKTNPCHEQHIVSIKEIYEEYLFSYLIPSIYEGLLSLYKEAYELEKKIINESKKNPNIEIPSVLILFQKLLKDIPNLNPHKIKSETERIKSTSKSAEIFDDLIRAVCKSNIILLTFNVDHQRKSYFVPKYQYHENIDINHFIHDCYIECSRIFHGYAELFYHDYEPIVLNQNKRHCHIIIKEGIKKAIRQMLPLKDILIEYNSQKIEEPANDYFDIKTVNILDNTGLSEQNGFNDDKNNFSILISDGKDDNYFDDDIKITTKSETIDTKEKQTKFIDLADSMHKKGIASFFHETIENVKRKNNETKTDISNVDKNMDQDKTIQDDNFVDIKNVQIQNDDKVDETFEKNDGKVDETFEKNDNKNVDKMVDSLLQI